MRRVMLLLGAAVPLGTMCPAAAGAQQAAAERANAEKANAEQAGAPDDVADDTIVVTAQKRSEAITDVPISITVITTKALEERGAKSLLEAQGVAPGIYFSGDTSYGTAPIAIRGTGGSGLVFGDEPVAVYVDNVYLGRSAGVAASDLLDIAAIEIVRGPQGTLQGRNATAGALLIRSNDPESDFGGSVNVLLADPQEYRVQGVLTGPLADGLDVRLAASYGDERGYARNLARRGRLGGAETSQVRGIVKWTNGDRFAVRITADYSDLKSRPATFRNAATGVVPPAPAAFVPTPQIALPRPDFKRIADGDFALDMRNESRTKAGGIVAEATLSFDAIDLVSITAYRESTIDGEQDSDSTGRLLGGNDGSLEFDQFSQELRLQSSGNGPLTYTAGLYYFEESQGQDPFRIFNYTAGAPFPAGPNGRTGTRAEFRSFQDTKSFAAFADGRYEVLAGTGITLGIRYTDEEKAFTVSRDVFLDAINVRLPAPTSISIPERTAKVDNVSYRVVLDHKFDSGALIYAKYGTGFKSGGFNAFGTEPAFEPEKLESFEIGAKAEFLDRRLFLSAAAYTNEYTNLQIRAGVPSGGIAIVNAADSKIKGIEIEGRFRATRALTFEASAAYTDAEFSSFPLARDILDLPTDATGNKLPRTPKTQYYIGASYVLTPFVGYAVQLNASYRWRDNVFFYQTDQDLSTFRGDSVGELDARIALSPDAESWSVAIFGRNLTDERVVTSVTPSFSYPVATLNDPRTIGLQLSYKF